eukprot:CAMPEP_0169218406 /NCGR_PEP_ID=MMETSP1016-20121227/19421_1 /TAXON_ID=342587 /ORGANISM="Karlodinium micrum, Strain CCMP2283" /LENGTH=177 /DNA_ID=CAMNT_0009296391 /DNA_START=201 /DNA_END=734 /DNA_ORIENTATION=-
MEMPSSSSISDMMSKSASTGSQARGSEGLPKPATPTLSTVALVCMKDTPSISDIDSSRIAANSSAPSLSSPDSVVLAARSWNVAFPEQGAVVPSLMIKLLHVAISSAEVSTLIGSIRPASSLGGAAFGPRRLIAALWIIETPSPNATTGWATCRSSATEIHEMTAAISNGGSLECNR